MKSSIQYSYWFLRKNLNRYSWIKISVVCFAQTFSSRDVAFSYFSWLALVFIGISRLFGIARSRKRNHDGVLKRFSTDWNGWKVKSKNRENASIQSFSRCTVQGGLRTYYYHNYIIATTKKIRLDIKVSNECDTVTVLRMTAGS